MDLDEQRAQVLDLVHRHLGKGEAWIVDLAQPAVSVVPCGASMGRLTRLGGTPLMPADTVWPSWDQVPLAFLGVVDLSEVAGLLPWLPTEGLANFFYDSHRQPDGFDPSESAGWRVVSCPMMEAVAWTAPDGVLPFPSTPVSLEPMLTIPDFGEEAWRRIQARNPEGVYDFFDAFEQLPGRGTPGHQIGGWPGLIQSPFWRECELASNGIDASAAPTAQHLDVATAPWRLLLQLDSDDRLEWAWEDGGCLYFSVREADAHTGQLDKTWLTLQSH